MLPNPLSTRRFCAGVAAVSAAAFGLAVSALVGATGTPVPTTDGTVIGSTAPAQPAPGKPEPRAGGSAPGTDRDATSAPPAGMERGTPGPVALRIPARDLAFPVRPVGVTRTGLMSLPDNPAVLGWYRFGPAPGQPGSSVLAGHVDSVEFGVGPLVRLEDVRPGDRIRVMRAAGVVDRYVVTRVDRYDRQRLPQGLFSRSGPSRLRVITCAGEYDADAGGYQLNLVVTARSR